MRASNWRNEVERLRYRKVKAEALAHYGPGGELRCSWPGCRENDLDVLTLDHINNDGCKERRRVGTSAYGNRGCGRLKKLGYPLGYQTLCANHQLKKELQRRTDERRAKTKLNAPLALLYNLADKAANLYEQISYASRWSSKARDIGFMHMLFPSTRKDRRGRVTPGLVERLSPKKVLEGRRDCWAVPIRNIPGKVLA